jgi:hypothetical protein
MAKACLRRVATGAAITAAVTAGAVGLTAAQAGASTAAQADAGVGTAILCPPPALVLMASSSGDPGC